MNIIFVFDSLWYFLSDLIMKETTQKVLIKINEKQAKYWSRQQLNG